MTLPFERARTRRPVTWLTLLGVLLLPVIVGGILVAALYNPTERLDALNAAIVNEDEPVEIDGQTVPLGRQLSAGLVEGSDDVDSNLTWTISNEDDAAEGLADGTYAAVVTIPANFSAAATSTQPGETPERATIEVTTPPDSKVVDDAITAQVTQTAASLVGQQLSEGFLENVFLGFTTLGEQLGEAASGASELADGAGQLADGAEQAASGAAELPGGIAQLGTGASQIAGGATGLVGGANQLQGGLVQIAGGIRGAADGARQISGPLRSGADQLERDGLVPAQVSGFADAAAASTVTTAQQIGGVAQTLANEAPAAAALAETLGGLQTDCLASGASQAYCDRVTSVAGTAGTLAGGVGGAAQAAGAAATSAQTAATDAGTTSVALDQFDTAATAQFVGTFRQTADGVDSLAGGLDQLAAGTDSSASGAGQLASGAGQLGTGAAQLATGAGQAAAGAQSLADGVQGLSDGAAGVAEGTTSLADGLATATEEIPTYTDAEATDLATVVSNPVEAEGIGSNLFGASAIPLLATLALWFGGLGTFVALQAVSRRTLTSRTPSALLALRSFAPAAVIGAVQGVLIAGVVQLAATYTWGEWTVFAAVCVVAGIAFAAVNQALVAIFGGAGRWIAALVGVLAVATGVVSTVPGVLASTASLMPTAPAYDGMLAALTAAGGLGSALAGLVIWTLLALLATVIAVARQRSVSARAVLASSASPA